MSRRSDSRPTADDAGDAWRTERKIERTAVRKLFGTSNDYGQVFKDGKRVKPAGVCAAMVCCWVRKTQDQGGQDLSYFPFVPGDTHSAHRDRFKTELAHASHLAWKRAAEDALTAWPHLFAIYGLKNIKPLSGASTMLGSLLSKLDANNEGYVVLSIGANDVGHAMGLEFRHGRRRLFDPNIGLFEVTDWSAVDRAWRRLYPDLMGPDGRFIAYRVGSM